MIKTIKKIADSIKDKGLEKEAQELYDVIFESIKIAPQETIAQLQQVGGDDFGRFSLPELENIHRALLRVATDVDEKIKNRKLAVKNQ
jgi:hypothetical protein